jgi:hypothetical protein
MTSWFGYLSFPEGRPNRVRCQIIQHHCIASDFAAEVVQPFWYRLNFWLLRNTKIEPRGLLVCRAVRN